MPSQRVVEVAPERLDGWLERFAANNPGPQPRQRVVGIERFDHAPFAVVLVRRGGYAVGLATASGELVAHKVGSRYVQSRTAAGGWSQQRFARRRGNQADELVRAVTEHVVDRLLPGQPRGLVAGGDRTLVAEVLADRRLHGIRDLPRRERFDLPDPNRTVLDQAVAWARTVSVTISE